MNVYTTYDFIYSNLENRIPDEIENNQFRITNSSCYQRMICFYAIPHAPTALKRSL